MEKAICSPWFTCKKLSAKLQLKGLFFFLPLLAEWHFNGGILMAQRQVAWPPLYIFQTHHWTQEWLNIPSILGSWELPPNSHAALTHLAPPTHSVWSLSCHRKQCQNRGAQNFNGKNRITASHKFSCGFVGTQLEKNLACSGSLTIICVFLLLFTIAQILSQSFPNDGQSCIPVSKW